MEQKKIDEITSIRYVGLEPSFKMYYFMVLGVGGILGLHHLTLKDIFGLLIHWGILFLGIIIGIFTLFIPTILVLIPFYIIPSIVAFYHYIDDDYFENIKQKKSWPFINRMLMIVPKDIDDLDGENPVVPQSNNPLL